jgi:hypothetical protein
MPRVLRKQPVFFKVSTLEQTAVLLWGSSVASDLQQRYTHDFMHRDGQPSSSQLDFTGFRCGD